MTVRDRLAELVKRSGISQAEIGRRMSPPEDRDWVSRRVLGKDAVEADDLCRLSDALDAPLLGFYADCASIDWMEEIYFAAAKLFGLTPEQVKSGGLALTLEHPAMAAGRPVQLEPLAERAAEAAVRRAEERIRELLHEAVPAGVREAPRLEEAAPEEVPPATPEERESDVLGSLGIAPDDPRWPQAIRVLRRLDEMLGTLSPFEQELVERMAEARRRLREEERRERAGQDQGE